MKYRLAYEGHSEVNWCPKLGTVLANDEIINDKNGNLISERGHHPVEKKLMRQWFMRITAYADRLLDNLEELDWSDHIKEIQRNWIGRSEGAEIDFLIKDSDLKIKVFTTRADTLFGATYVVLSPEHKLVDELKNKISNWKEVERFRDMVKNKTEEERTSVSKEKNGICLKGIMAINPANKEEVPVWIADYVLVSYGTGAVMAVPAHDERDWDFANKYKLPIKVVIEYPKDYPKDKPYTDYGIVINSEEMSWANGLLSQDAMLEIIEELEYKGLGKEVVKYKMRDAIFARQRYWGEPIPLIHNKDQTITALKEEDLPLKLPSIKSYSPSGTGESPLSLVSSWVKKGYETNTMPGWAGSSWYFLRYMDPKNNKDFASKKSLEYWNQVDMYIGGQEHSTGHLLYSRFWTNLLYDLGHLPFNEPFKKMKNQGMILGSDNRKMSKRWGNVVNPDDIIKTYGADTLRVYTMFMGPFDQMLPWSTESIIGSRRFLEKVWRIGLGIIEKEDGETSQKLKSLLHKTIKKTDQDIESFSFNTAVSSMMIFINELDKEKEMRKEDFKDFLKILSPFAPHLTEELWSFLGEKNSITQSFWPSWDEKLLEEDMIRIAIQVNGKVRDEIEVDKNMDERDIKNVVVSTPNVKKWIGEKEIKRFIYIPGKIINIVV